MGEYHIIGGKRLMGEVRAGGSKNAVLPMFAATVLNGGKSVLHNCPIIQDTLTSIEILKHIGCTAEVHGNTVTIDSAPANSWHVPEEYTQMMRSSILFMGGLLGRFRRAEISFPGGCNLGSRPIDLHTKAMGAMQCSIQTSETLRCSADSLTGFTHHLDFPSVGATENIMLAAVLAEGETVIGNAAREPEIVDLARFLNGMGADVRGAGSGTIVIQGVEKLHDVEHRVMPDRIVGGTYLLAAAITGGEILLTETNPLDLIPATAKLAEMGCRVIESEDTIALKAPQRLKYLTKLETCPHPGFPTDLQAPFVAALCVADGTSVVEETVFNSRSGHIPELSRMGADVMVMQDGRNFVIRGVKTLHGANVQATDLRCGAALILAGLAAVGETVVTDGYHVERGYQDIVSDLRGIGAEIRHVSL